VWLPKSKMVLSLLTALGTTSIAWAGPTAATTESVSAANTVNESQYGFSFSLPSNWKAIPLTGTDAGALLNAAKSADPALANVLDTQLIQAVKQGLKVYAVGPVSGTSFPNLNIGIESSSGSPTGQAFLPAMDADVKIALTEVGVLDLKTSDTRLPLGDALMVTYRLHLNAPSSLNEVGVQLYFEHGPQIYVITFTSPSMSLDQAVSHVVENSWRWK
jgi:hypothetical protein